MNKKRGSALILAVAVTGLLSVLAMSILTLSTTEYITTNAYDRMSRLKFVSQSGIDKGIALIRKNEGNINSTNNRITFKDSNGEISCTVDLVLNTNSITIISKAATSDGKYSKTTTVNVDRTAGFKSSSYIYDFLNNALTLIDYVGNNATFYFNEINRRNVINISGPVFIQGGYVDFKPYQMFLDSDLIVKAQRIDFGNTKPGNIFGFKSSIVSGKISIDAEESNMDLSSFRSSQTINGLKGVIQSLVRINKTNKIKLEERKPLEINSNLAANGLDGSGPAPVIFYKISSNSYYGNNLNSINDKITKEINNNRWGNDKYKVLMFKGNMKLNAGSYDKYIIYCDGNIDVEENVILNNSIVFGKSMRFVTSNSNLKIVRPDGSSFTDNIKNAIYNKIKTNLEGFYDTIDVKITDWIE